MRLRRLLAHLSTPLSSSCPAASASSQEGGSPVPSPTLPLLSPKAGPERAPVQPSPHVPDLSGRRLESLLAHASPPLFHGWPAASAHLSGRCYTLANFEESELRGERAAGSWELGGGVSTLLPTLRRASSAAGDWLVAGVGAGASALLPTWRRASSGAGGGELVVGGWLGAGSWRLYTLANFEEGELRGWRGAGGGELVAGGW
jgi:hypothetical protein